MEQREERLSLLRLSRVVTEEDEVSCLDYAERQETKVEYQGSITNVY